MKIRFIGDVHGKFKSYKKILNSEITSIQVGDFGMGFEKDPFPIEGNQKFIRGNHDNPELCFQHPNYIPDGAQPYPFMMCVGGASSIDKDKRIENVTWWRNEELSYIELCDITDKYIRAKPSVMITHDCPNDILQYMKGIENSNPSITQNALNTMFYMHKPKLWIFGHHHRSFNEEYDGTRFICLNELEYKDIEI